MEISSEINSELFIIPGLNIPVSNTVVMSWVAMAVIIIWAFVSTRRMKTVPQGAQSSAETVVELINNFAKNIMGEHGKQFAAYLGTIGLFLVISNTIGALFVGHFTGFVISPPTRDFSVAVALAIMTIVIVIGTGIAKKGFVGFIKSLFKPIWIMFPFNLLEFLIKPLSLSMRLFGNILGAFILMELIVNGIPLLFPSVACLYFDLFDGALQAFVFVLLTALYISEETEIEE